ncbi:MAG: phosphoserine phosphatase SerB [Candidatus Hydrothermarchaeales archaeon]
MKLVVFDLDSTLIDGESLDKFGKLVKKGKKISEITKKAMVGEISFEEALKKRANLLKGLEIEKIHKAAKDIPLMKGAHEAVSALKERGIKTAVISGGFSIVAERVKGELGLDYAVANEFVVNDGKITGEVSGPLTEEGSKGQVFEEIAAEAGVTLEDCVAIGDGANDVSMLQKAGLAIAFNSKPVLDKVADVVIKKNDLREILPHVLRHNAKDMVQELKEVEQEIARLKEALSAKKLSLTELSRKRKELIDSIKFKNADANKLKKQRDELNARVQVHKKERETANAKIKDLISEYKKLQEGVPKTDFKNAQRLKNSLEWKLQTSVMEIKKEDELVEKIEKLNSELGDYKGLIELSDRIDEHRKTSTKVHDAIITLSTESQTYHEKFLEAVRSIKELERQIDHVNLEMDAVGGELDELGGKLNARIKRSKVLEMDLKLVESKAHGKSDRELREHARLIYERFQKGEKLSLGDIYLLRRFNLV